MLRAVFFCINPNGYELNPLEALIKKCSLAIITQDKACL